MQRATPDGLVLGVVGHLVCASMPRSSARRGHPAMRCSRCSGHLHRYYRIDIGSFGDWVKSGRRERSTGRMGVSFQEPKYPVLQPYVARTQRRCAAPAARPTSPPLAPPPSCSRRSKIPSGAGASGEAAVSALQHIGRRPLAASRCGHGLVRWACVTGPPEAPRPPELALQEPRAGDPQSRLGISYAHICWWCGALISCCLPCAAQVVDPKPGFKRVVKNFQGKDYQTIGLATVLSMPFGYFAGVHACPDRLLSPILCIVASARM